MKLLGGTIKEPRELYLHRLGAALKMENTILEMLEELEDQASGHELQNAVHEHYEQTERHVRNVERAFQALGREPDESSCPAVDGLQAEGKANLKLVDEQLNDEVIMGAIGQTEHHEIAVYEELITRAEAMDEQDVVALLQENLEQEHEALERVRKLSRRLPTDAETAAW